MMGLAGCATHRLPPVPVLAGSEDLGAYYEETLGIEPVPVSETRFSDGGPEIRAEMLELIDGARDHILLVSFLLNDGPESREILDALAAKAAAGVDVRVIGDSSSRFVVEEEAFEYLNSRNVATAEFKPIRIWNLLLPGQVMERDHRKFWIVDGKTVFLGGANLSDTSLVPPEKGGNLDLMVRLESPEAARLLTESFVRTWNESRSTSPIDPSRFKAGESAPGSTSCWLFNQEKVQGRVSPTEVMLKGLFASAQKSVWLIEPYAFTNPDILADIRSLVDRGVEVNLLLSSQARAPRFRYASFFGIKDFLSAGARVWIFDSETSPLHHKCAVIDDRLAYVGSANLNLRSYYLSRELSVVFDDPMNVGAVREVVDSVRTNCREATMEEARDYRSLPFAVWWLIMQAAG